MRITVSGASGFIGQYVVQNLQAHNLDVIALTRSAASDLPQSIVSKRVVMDIANPPIDPFGAMGEPDTLIHLAWDGLPNYQSSRHVETELPAQLAFHILHQVRIEKTRRDRDLLRIWTFLGRTG